MLEEKDSSLYWGSLKRNSTFSLPCSFFKGTGDIPYVSLPSFLSDCFNAVAMGGKEVFVANGSRAVNSCTMSSFVFDVENNVLKCDDLDQALNYSGYSCLSFDALNLAKNANAKIVESRCSRKKGKAISFDLDRYNVFLIEFEGEVYAPLAFFDALFLSPLGKRVCWNGGDFYLDSLSSMVKEDGSLNAYGSSFYGGSLLAERSQASADLFYGLFLFQMENFYGKDGGLSFDLDAKLSEEGLKEKLLSSDREEANDALASSLASLFGDGGNTLFLHSGLARGYDPVKDASLAEETLSHDEKYASSEAASLRLKALRGNESSKLLIQGETAFFRLDSFSWNKNGESPSAKNVSTDETSTFAFLYKSFQGIEGKGIKNVVLDLTLNRGGEIGAMGEALSFLTDEDLEIHSKNALTGGESTEFAQYDTDLDGSCKDKDSYAGKYSFYVLISSATYSLGSLFASLCAEKGYAKVLGEKSSGGSYLPWEGISLDGASWSFSSFDAIVSKDGGSFDGGAAPDHVLEEGRFYDLAYLDSYLSGLA